MAGLKAGGWILINSPQPPEHFADQFARNRIATVDATTIARDNNLGTRSVPIVNTALAGAVCRMLAFPLEDASAALEHLGFKGSNLTAAARAYEEVRLLESPRESEPADELVAHADTGADPASWREPARHCRA